MTSKQQHQSQDGYEDLPKALELEFDAATGQIALTLFEHTAERGAVPLTLRYKFAPETPYAPIHQVDSPEVNKAVKQHCGWLDLLCGRRNADARVSFCAILFGYADGPYQTQPVIFDTGVINFSATILYAIRGIHLQPLRPRSIHVTSPQPLLRCRLATVGTRRRRRQPRCAVP